MAISLREDTAKLIRIPDEEFARPYFAIPNGPQFLWPLGTEGFELRETAELGRHKYLGEIQLDVDVVHKGEVEITLSGVFPGWDSVKNMGALRQIFEMDTPQGGKLLHLPGIFESVQYVAGSDMTYSHAPDERLMDISYSISFVKVGVGKKALVDLHPKAPKINDKKGTRKVYTSATVNTLRKIGKEIFNDPSFWRDLYAVPRNAALFDKWNVPSHLVPDYRIPPGTILYY